MGRKNNYIVYLEKCALDGKKHHRYIGKENNLEERIETHRI